MIGDQSVKQKVKAKILRLKQRTFNLEIWRSGLGGGKPLHSALWLDICDNLGLRHQMTKYLLSCWVLRMSTDAIHQEAAGPGTAKNANYSRPHVIMKVMGLMMRRMMLEEMVIEGRWWRWTAPSLGWRQPCEKKTKRSGLFGRKSSRQSFRGVDTDKLRSSH